VKPLSFLLTLSRLQNYVSTSYKKILFLCGVLISIPTFASLSLAISLLADDIKNSLLEQGAQWALVGMFGEGWCTFEFAVLPPKASESLLKGGGKWMMPVNAFTLLFAAEHVHSKLASIINAWPAEVREMILSKQKGINDIICSKERPVLPVKNGMRSWRGM
jgi:hypothetical protein